MQSYNNNNNNVQKKTVKKKLGKRSKEKNLDGINRRA